MQNLVPQTRYIDRSTNIIGQLADVLADANQIDLSRIAVIVPSRRLMSYLQLALTQRVQACIPPKILTIDSLAKVLPGSGKSVLSTTTQHIILTTLLMERKLPSLQRGMEPDLYKFYNEIADSGHDVALFDQIQKLLQENPFYDERHIEQLRAQTEAWKKLYLHYLAFLNANNSTDRALDHYERIVNYEKNGGKRFATFADHYYVVGFGDATPIQIRLFHLLQREVPCEFWFHCDSRTLLKQNQKTTPTEPLFALIQNLGLPHPKEYTATPAPHMHVARRLFRNDTDKKKRIGGADLCIHHAFSPLQEVKSVVAEAQNIILTEQARPEEIIIAVPDEETYGDLLWAMCDEAGLPVNYALGIPIIRTQIGQWLRLFFDLLANNAPLPVLLDLFNNKIANQWLASLGKELDKNSLVHQIHFIAQKYNLTSDLTRFIECAEHEKFPDLVFLLKELSGIAKPFADHAEHTLSEWTDILWELTETLRLHTFVRQNPGAYNLENRVLTRWVNGLQQLAMSGEMVQHKLTATNLESLILQNILTGNVRPAGQPFVGVQVLGMLELRSLSPKVVLVLGNTEGQFPDRPGRELFYSQPIRHKLGLTTTYKYEKLLDQQFYHLLCAAPQIHFFYSSRYNEEPLVVSRYLQRLMLFKCDQVETITTGQATPRLLSGDFLFEQTNLPANEQARNALHTLRAEVDARCDARGDFEGDRCETLSHYSYSTLKFLMLCPYRFLLARCKISEDVLPETDIEPADIGVWLHKVCQCFFQGLPENQLAPQWPDLFQSWNAPIAEENYERAYSRLQRLGKVLAGALGDHLQDLIFMEDVGWHIFLQQEMALGKLSQGLNHVEIEFDEELPEISDKIGRPCSATVRIDRITISEKDGYLIDYKKTIPQAKNYDDGNEPQLPFYYRFINGHPQFDSNAHWSGVYRDFKSQTPKIYKEERLITAWDNAVIRWMKRIEHLLNENGQYHAEPSDQACMYCQYAGICRRDEQAYVPKQEDI